MADKLSSERRSWNMRQIRSLNTKPEILIRSALHRRGFRFRIHHKLLPGRPDIVLSKYRTVVFINGCFWHQHKGCIEASRPKTNQDYWINKLESNIKRDRRNKDALRKKGWLVHRYWECEVLRNPERVADQIVNRLYHY